MIIYLFVTTIFYQNTSKAQLKTVMEGNEDEEKKEE